MTRVIAGHALDSLFQRHGEVTSDAVKDSMLIRYEHSERKRREKVRTLGHRREGEEDKPVQLAITLIQGKWKIGILSSLQKEPARLSQLRRVFPNASKKVLTQQLREMEKDGLIVRTDFSNRLRHVEYSLSKQRRFAVLQLISTLTEWSVQYMAEPLGLENQPYLFEE